MYSFFSLILQNTKLLCDKTSNHHNVPHSPFSLDPPHLGCRILHPSLTKTSSRQTYSPLFLSCPSSHYQLSYSSLSKHGAFNHQHGRAADGSPRVPCCSCLQKEVPPTSKNEGRIPLSRVLLPNKRKVPLFF